MSKKPTKHQAAHQAEARRRGRPALAPGGTTQLAIRFPNAMLELLDRHLAKRIDGQDRAAMIRELVGEAMIARGWVE